MSKIIVNTWESDVPIYSLKVKPSGWKKDFFTFHAALRLLQSNKLANIKDFVPDAPSVIDLTKWINASNVMSNLDTDRSGELDKDELGERGDFSVADTDGNGYVTEVEYYRYSMELVGQHNLRQSAHEIEVLATALNTYQRNHSVFPNTLDALWTKPNDFPKGAEWIKNLSKQVKVDPWGLPYHYEINGTNFTIRSNGPDRQENTGDDITKLE